MNMTNLSVKMPNNERRSNNELYSFTKYLDNSSVTIKLAQTMSLAIFQTIVNNTLKHMPVSKYAFEKFGDMFAYMIANNITVIGTNLNIAGEDQFYRKDFNFTGTVTSVYYALKEIYRIVSEYDITFSFSIIESDEYIRFTSIDGKWEFRCDLTEEKPDEEPEYKEEEPEEEKNEFI